MASARMVWVSAALLGSLAGSLLARSSAAACSCSIRGWTLELVRSNEPDPSLWPERAQLNGMGPFEFGSSDDANAQISYLVGGTWAKQ